MPHQHGQGPAQQGPQPLPGVDAIIAVGSGKGGVGKTTLSVNLAVALVKMGHKVGLLDADVYGPNVPLMLGVNDQPRMVGENRIEPLQAFGLKVISVGFLNPGDKPIIWRGDNSTISLSICRRVRATSRCHWCRLCHSRARWWFRLRRMSRCRTRAKP